MSVRLVNGNVLGTEFIRELFEKSKVIPGNAFVPFENGCHDRQGYRTAFYKPVTVSFLRCT